MKKLFTLLLLSVFCICIQATNRKWDFTQWSEATISKLASDVTSNTDTHWSDIEKANGTEADRQTGKCYWWTKAGAATLTTIVNGTEETIPETAGLTFNNESARALAIAVNYPQTSLGEYAGGSYLWMGGKNQSFIIPQVKPGAKITIEVESHKPTDGRGVALSVNGTAIAISEGSEKPKTKTTCVWTIPTDIADAPVDVKVTNNNGCHLYTVSVVEDAPLIENAKLAFVYDSQYPSYNADLDDVRAIITGNSYFNNVTVDELDASKDLSLVDKDSLTKYNVVIISGAISETNPYAATLKQAVSYVPMLNLNANMYKAWGYGEPITSNTKALKVSDEYLTYSLFKSLSDDGTSIIEDGTVNLFTDNNIIGVTYPKDSYFAADDTIATAGDAVAIHVHNADRNSYMFIPFNYENKDYSAEGNIEPLLINSISLLNYKKADIPQVAAPVFTNTYKNLSTDVAIKCSVSNAKIYYTTDGSTPSEASTLYTEPINITADGTVISAIAYADGYNASKVAMDTVGIYTTSAQPTISVEKQDGKSIVTLSTTEADAKIYYNITGSNLINESSEYTEPITVTSYTVLTAITGASGNKIQSEPTTQAIGINNKAIRIDEVSHFDANRADWSHGESKAYYYTEGKKNGYNYYVLTDSTIVKASDGVTDSTVYVVAPANNLTVYNPGNGWEFKSYGQGAVWENTTISKDIDDSNETKRYRAETAFDAGASNYDIQFGNVRKSNKTSNDPYSACIQSTEKFKGPFDVVSFVGNGSSSNTPKADIYISTDTTNADNWVKLDTVAFAQTQRYIKKNICSYEGTDEVFVKLQANFSSVMVMDIYIMNAGEKSAEATGIKNIATSNSNNGTVTSRYVYSINGTRLNEPAKGINIIKEVYNNGTVKTRKVIVR